VVRLSEKQYEKAAVFLIWEASKEAGLKPTCKRPKRPRGLTERKAQTIRLDLLATHYAEDAWNGDYPNLEGWANEASSQGRSGQSVLD
jgi:hypothetical protein